MPNDAKLGFLAGVAGVVAAAVLFYQNPPPAAPPAKPAGGIAAVSAPVAASTPVKPAPPVRASVPVAGGGRKELQGQTTSRPPTNDDE